MNRFFLPFFVLLAVVLSGCFGDNYEWYQKLTIVVETPDGIRTGSGVTKAEWSRNHFFKDGGRYFRKLTGEAAFVDLGGGRYLFATIGDYYVSSTVRLFAGSYPPEISMSEVYALIRNSDPTDLPERLYPIMVTFKNIHDPESIKEVNINNFKKIFGDEISLKRIEVAYFKDDISSRKIETLLNDDFFMRKAKIHKERMKKGVGVEYLSSIFVKMDRGSFIRDWK